MKPVITISSVLNDLKNGYTRTTSSPGYDSEIGSIQEKYGLNKTQVSQLFKHPQLLNKKTIQKKDFGFIIEDDVTPVTNESVDTSVEVSEVESFDNFDENATNGVETQTTESVVVEEVSSIENPFSFD